MLKGMTRYVVAVCVAFCVTSTAFGQTVRVQSPGHGARSPGVHVSVGHAPTVKRVVKKTWVAGEFVWHGRSMRWIPGHYEYKTIVMSCGDGHWTRQYGRDVWVAGRCTVM
jgi:hypothetical protein